MWGRLGCEKKCVVDFRWAATQPPCSASPPAPPSSSRGPQEPQPQCEEEGIWTQGWGALPASFSGELCSLSFLSKAASQLAVSLLGGFWARASWEWEGWQGWTCSGHFLWMRGYSSWLLQLCLRLATGLLLSPFQPQRMETFGKAVQ